MTIPVWMRREVVLRACNRCEYCRLSQAGQEATFHVDHVHPIAEGGETALDNLALACVSCSLRKGARRTAFDPTDGLELPVFHPRLQVWAEHFAWRGGRVVGRTPTGRATLALLKMNRAMAIAIRGEERLHGRHPPAD
jgi:hypothetical protein